MQAFQLVAQGVAHDERVGVATVDVVRERAIEDHAPVFSDLRLLALGGRVDAFEHATQHLGRIRSFERQGDPP